jgi:aspartate aminotransferase
MAVSATLAAHQLVEERRRAGLPVLPMSFGQAGVPVHPLLREALADASDRNAYGPVAGDPALREAAAGYWTRRGLPTEPSQVVAGPGSKALLYASLLAVLSLDPASRSSAGGDVILARPSWVSYAQQAALLGRRAVFVPTVDGGVVDPSLVRPGPRAMVVTLPDNPTGRLASPDTVRAACELAREHDLVIVSDEIYRDLTYGPEFVSPAELAPERTIVTTGLSKNLALGGWRIGVARFPPGPLLDRVLSVASELWSCPSVPIQAVAALAFTEPAPLRSYVDKARRLYERINRAVADRFAAAGALVDEPQAAFYSYPDLAPLVSGPAAEVAGRLLEEHGLALLPGTEFGEPADSLRFRVATGQLTGETDDQRREALDSPDPLGLPWIAGALDRLTEILAAL